MIHTILPPDGQPRLCQQGLWLQGKLLYPSTNDRGKNRFHSTGYPLLWGELGNSTGTSAQKRTLPDYLTLLYILHRPILS